jgi:fructokinase
LSAAAAAPDARPALGIDLGGTKIEARLYGADGPAGTELWRERIATPAGDYAATVQALAGLVERARQVASPPGLSIGIGTPGAAQADGRMKNCNSTCLNGMPLQQDVEAAVGQAVVLMNDANCLALSEATDGAGAGAQVVFAVIVGTGSGAGIAVDGRVLSGANAIAGEWGHNALPWCDEAEIATSGNHRCYCGRRGCIESMVAGPAIARDHAARFGGMLDAAGIAVRAAAGDVEARTTLDRHAERLARALAGVINLLDPDVIVLGGGLSLMPHLYEQVPRLWGRWVFGVGSHEPLKTRLVPARHGDASGVRGAAWIGRG